MSAPPAKPSTVHSLHRRRRPWRQRPLHQSSLVFSPYRRGCLEKQIPRQTYTTYTKACPKAADATPITHPHHPPTHPPRRYQQRLQKNLVKLAALADAQATPVPTAGQQQPA